MKKHLMIFLCFAVPIMIALIISLLITIPRIAHEKDLFFITESIHDTPSYVANGIVYNKDNNVDVSNLCRNYNKDYSLAEVLCVNNGRIYFVYSFATDIKHEWSIAYIDVEDLEMKEICTLTDVKIAYNRNNVSEFSERNGFYYNGNLVLNDYMQVLVYNIESDCTKQYAYEDYVFPERKIYGECLDSYTIEIYNGKVSSIFTLQDMAKMDDEIAKLYSMEKKQTWDKTFYLSYFFSENSVQIDGERIYAVGNCLNFSGESYGIILFYDRQACTWQYVTAVFTGDSAHGNCYIVQTD